MGKILFPAGQMEIHRKLCCGRMTLAAGWRSQHYRPLYSENGQNPAVRKKPALRRRTKRGLAPRRSAHLIPAGEAD